MDGEKFDSSRDRPGFFKFDIGRQRIKVDVGVSTMHKGRWRSSSAATTTRTARTATRRRSRAGRRSSSRSSSSTGRKRASRSRHERRRARRQATTLKAKGTDAFKAKKWADAQELYHDAGEYVDGEGGDEARALLLSCLLNQARCALAQSGGRPPPPRARALALDGASMKAYFRRARRASSSASSTTRGRLREAAKLDPKSREVREAIAEAKARAEGEANDKAMYSKMFG